MPWLRPGDSQLVMVIHYFRQHPWPTPLTGCRSRSDPNDGGIGGDPDLPPGTASPTPDDGIFRVEEGGDAQTFFYDSSTDEFTVDNLPFDAVGPQPPGATGDRYVRVTAAPAIGTLDPDGIQVTEELQSTRMLTD